MFECVGVCMGLCVCVCVFVRLCLCGCGVVCVHVSVCLCLIHGNLFGFDLCLLKMGSCCPHSLQKANRVLACYAKDFDLFVFFFTRKRIDLDNFCKD